RCSGRASGSGAFVAAATQCYAGEAGAKEEQTGGFRDDVGRWHFRTRLWARAGPLGLLAWRARSGDREGRATTTSATLTTVWNEVVIPEGEASRAEKGNCEHEP
ncbi:MAG TPA: hypothetical protein VFI91_07685, partial [Longimicrobiaceae bacterium]|nr:hypothetical protein [Longimicrobiaceae bacterium]